MKVAPIFIIIFVISTSKYVSIHKFKKIGGMNFLEVLPYFQASFWCESNYVIIEVKRSTFIKHIQIWWKSTLSSINLSFFLYDQQRLRRINSFEAISSGFLIQCSMWTFVMLPPRHIQSVRFSLCYYTAPWVRAGGRAWFSWPTVYYIRGHASLPPDESLRLSFALLRSFFLGNKYNCDGINLSCKLKSIWIIHDFLTSFSFILLLYVK